MSNSRYDYANQQFLSGQLNWLTQAFRVVLVDTSAYTVLKAVHHSLADIPSAARVATSDVLTGMTATNGVARADDVQAGPVFGPTVEALVIYHDTGVESTSELIAYLDNAHGLPYSPQGDNVRIHWDVGPLGIFTL